jgi:2-amino-4-hydroxy-6-hydroxymethyldihydropteridine diphosphokinase
VTRAVLSIGSNLGDRLTHLQSVVDALRESLVAVSPVYETVPWGGPDLVPEQGAFLNAVLIADDPALDCRDWLQVGQQLETAAERVRDKRWGPRTLDVDLIQCSSDGREFVLSEPNLTLPHPRAHLRAFVLVPWLDIDPQAELTVAGKATPIAALLDDIEPVDKAGVAPTDLMLQSAV